MSQDSAIYDLGAVDIEAKAAQPKTQVRPVSVHRAAATNAPPPGVFDSIANSVGLFAPGAGQLLRRRWSDGLFVLSAAGFLCALGWAVWATLERLPGTLQALGWPPHGGLYALGLIYVALAWIHAGNLLYATSRGPASTHPVLAGCASALVPGWGQVLNRQPVKASLFVAGVWLVGLVWLLSSAWISTLFESQGVSLRGGARLISSPAVLWTVPVVLWALAVYDAAATARR